MTAFFWKKNGSSDPLLKERLSSNFFLLTILLAINLFFGFLKFANFFSVKFFYFYSAKIVQLSLFDSFIDWVVWGATFCVIVLEVLFLVFIEKRLPSRTSLLCLAGIGLLLLLLFDSTYVALLGFPITVFIAMILGYFGFGYHAQRNLGCFIVILGGVCIVIFLSAASLITWVWNIFDYSFPLVELSHWRFALIDLNIFNVLYPWISWLFLVLLFSWAWIPIVKRLILKIGGLLHSNLGRLSSSLACCSFDSVHLRGRKIIFALLVMVALSVFVSYYPYFNRSSSALVGSDSGVYYGWMEDMTESGPWIALKTDRPLSNLLMYGIQHAFGLSSLSIVRIMPVLCCVGLSLAVFWFVRVGLRNDVLALISGFFTICSFHTTVGVYAYSVSNWLGLIFAFLVFGFVLKGNEKRSWGYAFFAALFGVGLLFTHPYTWDVIVVVLSAYLVWQLIRIYLKRSGDKIHALQVFAVLVTNSVALGLYSILPFGRGVTSGGVGFAGRSLVFPNLMNLQDGLKTSVEMWVGGLYANPLMLILAVFGMIALVGLCGRFSRLITLWVMVPSLVLFVVSSENYMFYRLLYVLPVQVLAALGLFWIFRIVDNNFVENKKLTLILKVGLFLAVFLLFLTYAIRSVDGALMHLV